MHVLDRLNAFNEDLRKYSQVHIHNLEYQGKWEEVEKFEVVEEESWMPIAWGDGTWRIVTWQKQEELALPTVHRSGRL